MNDPFTERLGRLTPDTTGLDRDALLFQAGRASVHPKRHWPAVAGLLFMSQTATLAFFLTRKVEPATNVVVVPQPQSVTPAIGPENKPVSIDPREWVYRRAAQNANVDDLPTQPPIENSLPPGKVLTVLSVSSVLTID